MSSMLLAPAAHASARALMGSTRHGRRMHARWALGSKRMRLHHSVGWTAGLRGAPTTQPSQMKPFTLLPSSSFTVPMPSGGGTCTHTRAGE